MHSMLPCCFWTGSTLSNAWKWSFLEPLLRFIGKAGPKPKDSISVKYLSLLSAMSTASTSGSDSGGEWRNWVGVQSESVSIYLHDNLPCRVRAMHDAMLSRDQSPATPWLQARTLTCLTSVPQKDCKNTHGAHKGLCCPHRTEVTSFFPLYVFCRTHSSLKSHVFRGTAENPKPFKYRYCKLCSLPSVYLTIWLIVTGSGECVGPCICIFI